jgi:hypothetical protein
MAKKCDKCNTVVHKRSNDWDFWMKIKEDADIFQGCSIIRLCNSCLPPVGFIVSRAK